ncbi:hypothetical protein ABZW32_20665 [Streptomyces sp. NPDC004667]|uniref:hypothetical protein n=1 Tax=Streptomyces sp. NPDC004667 TaxID=3154285 RepID=UPI0033B79C9E
MKAFRCVLGALGLLLIAVGGRLVADLPDPMDVLVWLGGSLVLHDGVIAPLVLAAGLLLAAAPARGPVRGGLITGSVLVLVTLPALLRPGVPANPTALPLPYGRNLLIVLGAVAAVTVVAAVVTAPRRRARGRPDTGTRTGGGPGGAGRRQAENRGRRRGPGA